MLDIKQAIQIVREALPDGRIQKFVLYKDLYLFQVFNDRPFEEEMDPFFSVNKETSEFKDFSIFTDGDPKEVIPLFQKAKKI